MERGPTVPGIDFDRLRREITMEQVLQLLGFEPSRRQGDQWYGRCPLHDSPSGRKPCFSVNVALKRYYCHRCHRGGNQLELWAAATNLPWYQAMVDLCRALGREAPWLHRR
jgi:DNA primase